MAVPYKDIYRATPFKERALNLQQEIASLYADSEAYYFNQKNNLKEQLDKLKQQEKQIFLIFNVNSLEELNKRLEDFRKATLNLSVGALEEARREYNEKIKKVEKDAFQAAVDEIIRKDFLDPNCNYIETTAVKIREQVLKELNNIKGKGIKITSDKGYRVDRVRANEFTKAQKQLWEEFIKKKVSESSGRYPEGKNFLRIKSQRTSLKDNIYFDWFGDTLKYTKKEAEKFSPERLNRINKDIVDKIINMSSGNNTGSLIKLIINYMLKEDPYMFFVGKNMHAITGILGEIQTLFYLCCLFGILDESGIPTLGKDIIWRANSLSNGKKPHQDVVLKEILGIQVKNISDKKSRISFAGGTLSSFLDKVNLNPNTKLIIENFYGTKYFNVPYHKEINPMGNSIYAPGLVNTDFNADIYQEGKDIIENLNDEIEKILNLFMVGLMYLDERENILGVKNNTDTNSLFFVGSMAYTGATLIEKAYNNLENIKNKRNFRITSSTSADRNIIMALNDSRSNRKKMRKEGTSYSQFSLNAIKLTSTYFFK